MLHPYQPCTKGDQQDDHDYTRYRIPPVPPVVRITLPLAIDGFELDQLRSMLQMFRRFLLPSLQFLTFKIKLATSYLQSTVKIRGMTLFYLLRTILLRS